MQGMRFWGEVFMVFEFHVLFGYRVFGGGRGGGVFGPTMGPRKLNPLHRKRKKLYKGFRGFGLKGFGFRFQVLD